jgi:hypothetical protein
MFLTPKYSDHAVLTSQEKVVTVSCFPEEENAA